MQLNVNGYAYIAGNPAYISAVGGRNIVTSCLYYYDDMNPYTAFSLCDKYVIGAPNMLIKNLSIKVVLQ